MKGHAEAAMEAIISITIADECKKFDEHHDAEFCNKRKATDAATLSLSKKRMKTDPDNSM